MGAALLGIDMATAAPVDRKPPFLSDATSRLIRTRPMPERGADAALAQNAARTPPLAVTVRLSSDIMMPSTAPNTAILAPT